MRQCDVVVAARENPEKEKSRGAFLRRRLVVATAS
jgi:hypothetical protein